MAVSDMTATATVLIESLAPRSTPVVIRTPLAPDESDWFVRGVDAGIVVFRECPDDCFRFVKWRATGPDHFDTPAGKPRHLFSRPDADAASLNREYVPHIAAYARAILDFGYTAADSSFSLYRRYSRDLLTKRTGGSYETDAEFYAPDGSVHLQVEAKADARGTERIAHQVGELGELRELPSGSVKELEYVLDIAPRYLWIVGPGSVDPATHVFAVVVDGLNARFEPIDTIPLPPSPKT